MLQHEKDNRVWRSRKCVLLSWQYFHTKTNNDLSFRNSKYIFVCTNPSHKLIVLEHVNVLCRILHPRAVNIVQETHQSFSTHKLGRGWCSNLLPYWGSSAFGIFTIVLQKCDADWLQRFTFILRMNFLESFSDRASNDILPKPIILKEYA
jgi:hypothetical protein